MTARDLLRRLDDSGVALTLAGDRIKYRAGGDRLTPDLLAEMKLHRDELVSLLARRAAMTWPPSREQAGTAPLSRAQRTLWATDYFVRDGTYNLAGALRLRGPLDTAALAAAVDDLHRRHPSLRTVFPIEHGEPGQRVLPDHRTPITVRETSLVDCVTDCARLADERLPLDGDPPVRMRLYRVGADDHVFFVVLHHVIADGYSVGVLLDDLAHCYNTRLRGSSADPDPDAVDMVDYARWERERLDFGDLGGVRRYWQDRLAGANVGPLPLPPPRGESTERGSAHKAVIDPGTTRAIRELVSGTRSSAFLVVTAAVSAVLSRYTGREDMVVGMPVARRDLPGLPKVVGLLLDMVPVRLDTSAAPTFRDLVKRTRTAVYGAVRHAPVPADVAAGDATGRGLYNVIITDLGTREADPSFAGVETSQLDVPQVGAKYDLNVLVRDDGDTLAVELEYDRRALAAADVAALADMVGRVLAEGVSSPGLRVADLAATPFGVAGSGAVGEKPARVPGSDESLVSRIAEMARLYPDAVAVVDGSRRVSYQDFMARVGAIASGLRSEGVAAGDIVAIALPKGIELVTAIVAVMASGAASLVLDDSWPEARVDDVLTDSGARLVIDDSTLARLGQGEPCPPVTADATAYVIYTSGSTGRPKGVRVTHRNVLSLLDATAEPYGFGPHDVWTLFHACSFDVAMYELFGCLAHGGTLVVVPKATTREPEAFAALLGAERVTILSQTPSALSVMLPAIARDPSVAAHVRHIFFAGEALDRKLADQWYASVGGRARLVNMYGITETTVHASWHWLSPDDVTTAESDIGGPLPGTALHLLHDNGTSVADRCVGEIFVGGPQVSGGYVGRPRETALRFLPDPFSPVPGARMYRSGDMGRRDGERMTYLGRRDNQVQVNGFRVELAEIEEALTACPGVSAAGAAVARDEGGARVVAAVVGDADPAELLRAVRAVLPRYMVPHTITSVDALPLTNNGKLDRATVLSLVDKQVEREPVAAAPDGAVQATLLDLYREVLQDGRVSAADDFFDRGGDSMRAIRLVGLARERGLHLSVSDIYAASDLASLAQRVEQVGDAPEPRTRPFSLLPDGAAFADDVVDAYPMTAMQSGMIYHQELAPGARVYHIMLSYRVRGHMEPEAFRQAAQAVTDAHPVLRTSLDLANANGPIQRVHTGIAAPVEFEDIRGLSAEDQLERIRQVGDAERATDFDLAAPPLFRLIVLITSDDDYQLVFTHHHAILDGWSVNIFFEDLHAQYLHRLYGAIGEPLTSPRTTLADYVALERAAVEDPAHQEFWRSRTAGEAPLIAPDRPATPAMRQYHAAFPGMIGDLRDTATRVGVPMKALLCAAHVRVVSWLTGSDDVTTSMVFPSRPEGPDAERLLGLFLNQLPMRVRLGDQTWAELARELHADEMAMLAHRWYPNAAIQAAYGPRPLFDSSFNFTDYHTTRQLVVDGTLEVLSTDELESTHYAYGSNYTVDLKNHELRVLLEFDENALSRPTLQLAAEAHRRALAAMIADIDAPMRATALPGMADLARLLRTEPAPAPALAPAPAPAPAPKSSVDERNPDLERSIREVWTEVLGPGDYDPHTDFFTSGGDSLTAMQVVSRLRARHGTLSMGTFMAAPTIADLANALSTSAPAAPAPAVHSGPQRYPLSSAQHQMWLIAKQLPQIALFGMPGALQVDGPLDHDVLRRTLASVIARHEALRTRVEETPDGVVQVVQPHATLDVETIDLSAEDDPAARCERLMLSAVREPMPLDRPPFLRAILYRLAEDRHVLYLNIHHIVSDGWSLTLLLNEFADTYRAGGHLDRPAPRGSGALAESRARWADTPEAARQRAYWLDQLAPPWSALKDGPGSRFATIETPTFVQRLRSAYHTIRLDQDVVDTLRANARANGMTDFMVLLAAYSSTLRTWSGHRDIRVATVVANRTEPGMEEIVGLVANTVVLRMDIAPDTTPRATAEQARKVAINAFTNQELPFEDILAATNGQTGPVFEVMLVMQEATPDKEPEDGLTFTPYKSQRNVLGAPIAATASEFILGVTPDVTGGMSLTLQYKPATTDPDTARELLADIATTLATTARALGEAT